MVRAVFVAIVGVSIATGCSDDVVSPEVIPTAETGDPTTRPPGTIVGGLPRDALVVPDGDGVVFLDLDGTVLAAPTWTVLAGSCDDCGGEGASPDGAGLLLSFTTGGGGMGVNRPGAIARVNADGTPDFRVDGFGFPHDVVRDPADDSLMVIATSSNEVVWIPGDGSTNEPLRVLDNSDPEFPNTPNGAERFDFGGRTYLLITHRPQQGRVTFWDITTPGAPEFVWRFPATGRIAVPHCPILRQVDNEWWLIYAHTNGSATGQGSVGLAVTSDPLVAPTYVADLEPGDDAAPFTFLRGVELLEDGRLIVTDSGRSTPGAENSGRVFVSTFPDLSPTGEGGNRGDQRFEPLGPATLLLDGLAAPFEGWFWAADSGSGG